MWLPPALDALSNSRSPTALPATGLTPGVNLLPGDRMGTGWGHHLALCSAPLLAVHLPPSCLGQGLFAAEKPAPEALQPLLPLFPTGLSRCAQRQECDIPIPCFLAAGKMLGLGQQTQPERATWAQGTAGLDCPTSLGPGLCQPGLCCGGAGSCPCSARGVSSTSLCIAAASCLRRATATARPHRGQRPPCSTGAAGAAWRVRRVVSVLSAEQADKRDTQGGHFCRSSPRARGAGAGTNSTVT